MTADVSSVEIADSLRALFASPAACIEHEPRLAGLLRATNSRAVGCWEMRGDELELIAFLAVDDMPVEVQREFVAATRRVALTQSKFGVVQAVLGGGPAINHRPEQPIDARDSSPGWLERFEAASSLAGPIFADGQIRGALAVATVKRIEPEDDVWRLVGDVVARL